MDYPIQCFYVLFIVYSHPVQMGIPLRKTNMLLTASFKEDSQVLDLAKNQTISESDASLTVKLQTAGLSLLL